MSDRLKIAQEIIEILKEEAIMDALYYSTGQSVEDPGVPEGTYFILPSLGAKERITMQRATEDPGRIEALPEEEDSEEVKAELAYAEKYYKEQRHAERKKYELMLLRRRE